ncbi:MAG: hypothetical protein WD490_07970 [Opitutales bacterium]
MPFIYSRKEPWVQDCLGMIVGMIVGRIVYAGSKLALSSQVKNTALWELCGIAGKVDVERHCYKAMDRLLRRQKAIPRTLVREGRLFWSFDEDKIAAEALFDGCCIIHSEVSKKKMSASDCKHLCR